MLFIPKTVILLSISKDRIQSAPRNRTPRSREPRSTKVAASTTHTNENDDDPFASISATAHVASSSSPTVSTATAVPVISPPPELPVTGLPDKSAAIAAKQTNSKEKKKFSLFDSDDSEIDELLFGTKSMFIDFELNFSLSILI